MIEVTFSATRGKTRREIRKIFSMMKTHAEDVNELVNRKIKARRKRATKAWKGNKMSTASAHAHKRNFKSTFSLTSTSTYTNILQLKNRKFYFKLLCSVTNKMALTCSAREIHCPTIERQLNSTNIKHREKHMFIRVVGLKVVVSEANGGRSL